MRGQGILGTRKIDQVVIPLRKIKQSGYELVKMCELFEEELADAPPS